MKRIAFLAIAAAFALSLIGCDKALELLYPDFTTGGEGQYTVAVQANGVNSSVSSPGGADFKIYALPYIQSGSTWVAAFDQKWQVDGFSAASVPTNAMTWFLSRGKYQIGMWLDKDSDNEPDRNEPAEFFGYYQNGVFMTMFDFTGSTSEYTGVRIDINDYSRFPDSFYGSTATDTEWKFNATFRGPRTVDSNSYTIATLPADLSYTIERPSGVTYGIKSLYWSLSKSDVNGETFLFSCASAISYPSSFMIDLPDSAADANWGIFTAPGINVFKVYLTLVYDANGVEETRQKSFEFRAFDEAESGTPYSLSVNFYGLNNLPTEFYSSWNSLSAISVYRNGMNGDLLGRAQYDSGNGSGSFLRDSSNPMFFQPGDYLQIFVDIDGNGPDAGDWDAIVPVLLAFHDPAAAPYNYECTFSIDGWAFSKR